MGFFTRTDPYDLLNPSWIGVEWESPVPETAIVKRPITKRKTAVSVYRGVTKSRKTLYWLSMTQPTTIMMKPSRMEKLVIPIRSFRLFSPSAAGFPSSSAGTSSMVLLCKCQYLLVWVINIWVPCVLAWR